jgi:hypothetical protein
MIASRTFFNSVKGVPSRTWALVAMCLVVMASLVSGSVWALSSGPLKQKLDWPTKKPKPSLCGGAGQACCTPPVGVQKAGLPKLVACGGGLGCNLSTGTCVAPCGGVGQACCDGPETRAMRWTSKGRVFSPAGKFLKDMCTQGICDAQSHVCTNPTCGTVEGQSCCPPSASQATAKCVADKLYCEFNNADLNSGSCLACGSLGREPCATGCTSPLGVLRGRCADCGRLNQAPCDSGCKDNLRVNGGVCSVCGGTGQPPCNGKCDAGLGQIGGKCTKCGGLHELACDTGCNQKSLIALSGVCTPCGLNLQPACAAGCTFGLDVVGGICQRCGDEGLRPCDRFGCLASLNIDGGICRRCGSLGQPPCSLGCLEGRLEAGICK